MTIDIPATITSLGTLIAAVGALIVSVINAMRTNAARTAAIAAGIAAENAKQAAAESKAEIVLTKEGVFEVGKQLDGRLKQLLEVTETAARAKGRAEGRQEERDDAAGRSRGGQADGQK